MNFKKSYLSTVTLLCIMATGCTSPSTPSSEVNSTTPTTANNTVTSDATAVPPGNIIDLSFWNITIPTDINNDGKVDSVKIPQVSQLIHPDFFYVNSNREVVFSAPNKALTTVNSSNTRSELRHMSRGSNKKVKTKDYGNNFSVQAHPKSAQFAAVGGKLEATLRVNHVSVNAGRPDKFPAYSAVVGQIHGVKESERTYPNAGYGNEPIKIYYKKWPKHKTGSVFWTYERNLAKEHPDRTDIAYAVWGNTWENPADPGSKGISLNEEFSYTINVHNNIMHLTFENARLGTVKQSIDLSNNVDANGVLDEKDNPEGYSKDQLYFKAGIYNQCSTSDKEGFWYAACPGIGKWSIDKANGNYAQASFSKIELNPSVAP